MYKYEITNRLKGTKQAYWILKVWREGEDIPFAVHTGKGKNGYRYISDIRNKRYPNAIPRSKYLGSF